MGRGGGVEDAVGLLPADGEGDEVGVILSSGGSKVRVWREGGREKVSAVGGEGVQGVLHLAWVVWREGEVVGCVR